MVDPIKEAFARAKGDIESLRAEVSALAVHVIELKKLLEQKTAPTPELNLQTNTRLVPTHRLTELHKSTPEALKTPYTSFSTGNEGVPSNQPTNHQTNQHTGNEGVAIKANFSPTDKPRSTHPLKDEISHLARVSEILASLDGLKKDVRIKFKRLTEQEMAIFTKIYEFDDGGIEVSYEILAHAFNLTEISIRDYVRKIITKGIPVVKTKQNNKRILLSISDDLKQIASLQTIHQLREL